MPHYFSFPIKSDPKMDKWREMLRAQREAEQKFVDSINELLGGRK